MRHPFLTPCHNLYQRHRCKRHELSNQLGFTLLEVVVSLILLGMLSAIFGMGLVKALQSHEFSRTNVDIAQKAQLAMTRMRRELSELTDIVAIDGTGDDPYIIYERLVQGHIPPRERFGIHYHQADGMVRIYTDLNPTITSLDAGTIDQGDVLVDGADSLSMNFYQGSATWSMGADIQLLSSIDLNLSLARPDALGQSQSFQTRLHLRNNNNYGGAAPTLDPVSRQDYSCFLDALTMEITP